MSFRLLTSRLLRQSRYALQWYYKRDIFTNILENGKLRGLPTGHLQRHGGQQQVHNQQQKSQVAVRASSGLFRFGQQARKLFIDNILNRVTSSYSTDLRARATKKLFYGDSAPFFALVGVGLASGSGVLTKEDELEGVCWEIREAASKIQNSWNAEQVPSTKISDKFSLDDLDIGPPIAKGCAAVVYAASLKNSAESEVADVKTTSTSPVSTLPETTSTQNIGVNPSPRRDSLLLSFQNNYNGMLSPIRSLSRFVHNFGGSVDNLFVHGSSYMGGGGNLSPINLLGSERRDSSEISAGKQEESQEHEFAQDNLNVTKMEVSPAAIDICRYPLALKMMFNYDIQSNAMSILRAMYKETIPARYRPNDETSDGWEKLLRDQTLTLPPHPNIVVMFGYFCAEVRNLIGGRTLYPMAQPPRINPHGYGRNMSLYLLMKRYDCSLRSYLDGENVTMRTRILLFAQLLEAVAHLARHGVAHRDLKSDNILIELNDDGSPPVLVLSDFGCCLADKVHGLSVPYTSYDMDKGGNTALMAPEIINKAPGTFSFLNYTKSDLWACGAIAYEIFGHLNPFYSVEGATAEVQSLKNVSYSEENLPDLGAECPLIVRELVTNILNSNPNRRLSPDVAANVMQLFLWAPSSWLKPGGTPASPEILQWLLSLTTKVMCEGQTANNTSSITYRSGRRTYTEYLLICSFLARAKLRRLRGALSWIQSIV